jgi:hypothetical protein
MSELKQIDLKTGKFSANGHNYTILKQIPLSRYRQFKKLQPRLIYGMDAKTLMQNCLKSFNYLNSPKPEPANAAIILHNIMSGIKDVDDDSREDPALLICSLIIVRDGEDIGVYDEVLCAEKIRDWEKEGYEPDGFFLLALTSINAFKQTFDLFMSQVATTE